MTVLFSDLVGSTQLLDGRDPEDALEILDGYRMAVRSTIERLGGFVLLHAGEGRRLSVSRSIQRSPS